MAFLSGWLYRKPVTLSRASGAVTNYQMKLFVGESAASFDPKTDAFTGADESPLSNGGLWTNIQGTGLKRVSNAVAGIAGAAAYRTAMRTDYFYPDHYCKVSFAGVGAEYAAAVVRARYDSGGLFYYSWQCDATNKTSYHFQTHYQGAAETTVNITGGPNRDTYPIQRLKAIGNSMIAEYWNGSSWVNITTQAATLNNFGAPGIRMYRNTGTTDANVLDDWEGGSIYPAGSYVDCGGKCKSDFSDLRFTASDGTTELDYWIESVSGTTPNQVAVVWVEFNSIGTGDTTFYMYYGNTGASAASNGPNTFIVFDDFNALNDGDIAGQNGWDAGANVAYDVQTSVKYEGAKALTVNSLQDGNSCKKAVSSWNIWLEGWIRLANVSLTYCAILSMNEGTSEITGIGNSSSRLEHLYATSPFWQLIGVPIINDNWYKIKMALNAKTTHKIWVNDGLMTPANLSNYTNVVTNVTNISFRRYNLTSGPQYLDVVKVGQYLATEPALGSWGAEELGIQHYTLELEPASFTMTGAAMLLTRSAISLGLSPGVFSMVGASLSFPKAFPPMALEAGAFAMAGAELSIRRPVSYMRMDPGAFAMIGKPVDVKYHWYSGEAGSNYEFQKQRRKF